MEAKVTTFIKVLALHELEGDICVEVNCRDYNHYASLPEVIEVYGRLLARTGWNSDSDRAFYKTGETIAIPR